MTCLHNNTPCTICWMDNPRIYNTQILTPIKPQSEFYRKVEKYKDRVYIYFRKKKVAKSAKTGMV